MKKFAFIIVAATLAASTLISCGGNTDKKAADSDSIAVDSASTAAEEIPIKELKELDCDHYIAKVPENWVAGSRMVNFSCVIELPESPFIFASLDYKYQTLDEFKAEAEKDGWKAIDDITMGDKTWVAYYKENKSEKEQMAKAATPQADGVVTARLQNGQNMMDFAEAGDVLKSSLKVIIENITLK